MATILGQSRKKVTQVVFYLSFNGYLCHLMMLLFIVTTHT